MPEEKTFIKKTQPKNVQDVISGSVLKRLLDSYRFPFQTALTIYCLEKLPLGTDDLHWVSKEDLRWASMDDLHWLELEDEYSLDSPFYKTYWDERTRGHKKSIHLNAPFCDAYWHDPNDPKLPDKHCEETCKKHDRQIVLMYYEGKWNGPKLFHCLCRLWDMAYPLFVGGRLVGVLYGGQVIVTEEVKDWLVELEEIINEVVWNPFDDKEIPSKSDQIKEIRAAINAMDDLSKEKKKQLRNVINKEKKKDTSVKDLVKQYNKFKEFGETLEGVLVELYAAQAETARREHIHESSKEISTAGDQLSEEPEKFWNALDKMVQSTLPDVKGYVFYKIDKYGEAFEPIRTHIYYEKFISDYSYFRNFCKHVFGELHKVSRQTQHYVLYELMNKNAPIKFCDLFRRAIQNQKQVSGGASVTAVPLVAQVGGVEKVTGGLVCVCAGEGEIQAGEIVISERFLKFYVEALKDIADVLSMVLARRAVEDERVASQIVRAHELVAPVHAILGFHDNLSFIFEHIIKKAEALIDLNILMEFEKQLKRLGDLCELLGLISTGCSEVVERFWLTNFASAIVFPVVPPLHTYAKAWKKTTVWYDGERFLEMPNIWMSAEGIKQCMFNLVFNAVKYSNKESKIEVRLNTTSQNFEICIINNGIGVPKGEEELIFQRFRQGSNADTVAAYGAGLGLYISRLVARIHGGDIKLVDGKPEKTIFALILPKSLEYGPPKQFQEEL